AYADQPDAAHRAAESGMDAELHLREAQRQPVIARGDAVAAGERQLEPTAEREALDQRDGRTGQRLQPVEELLAGVNEAVATLGAGDAGELLDVGARDEAALF